MPTWFLISSFASREAYDSFEKLLEANASASSSGSPRQWQPEVEFDTVDEDFTQNFSFVTPPFETQWTLQELSNVVNQTGTLAEGDALRSIDTVFVGVGFNLASLPAMFLPQLH